MGVRRCGLANPSPIDLPVILDGAEPMAVRLQTTKVLARTCCSFPLLERVPCLALQAYVSSTCKLVCIPIEGLTETTALCALNLAWMMVGCV